LLHDDITWILSWLTDNKFLLAHCWHSDHLMCKLTISEMLENFWLATPQVERKR